MNLNDQEKELLKDVFHKSFHEGFYEIEMTIPETAQRQVAIKNQKNLSDLYKRIFGEDYENIV